MVTQLQKGIHTTVSKSIKMFSILTNKIQRKNKDFTKIINNLTLYFEHLGTSIFKEHFLVAVSVKKNF